MNEWHKGSIYTIYSPSTSLVNFSNIACYRTTLSVTTYTFFHWRACSPHLSDQLLKIANFRLASRTYSCKKRGSLSCYRPREATFVAEESHALLLHHLRLCYVVRMMVFCFPLSMLCIGNCQLSILYTIISILML